MLELEQVSRHFTPSSGITDVTLRVSAGEVVALVGLNGAGKTTIMRVALAMVRPERGQVRLFGQRLSEVPSPCWSRVGALVETPLAYRELSVAANLTMAARLRGATPSVATQAMETWGLEPVAGRRFHRLSMGTKQRVGLAAAFQHQPDLILLDEPSNGLDPASVIILRDQVLRAAGRGAAVLVSSHHLDEVARIADRIVMVNAGRMIGNLRPQGPDLERAFFNALLSDDQDRAGVARS